MGTLLRPGTPRALLLAILVVGLSLPAVVSVTSAATVNWWSATGLGIGGPGGNPNCDDADGVLGNNAWIELKIDPPAPGVYTDGTLTVTLSLTPDGNSVIWTSNIGVDAVIVKGGPNAAIYVYDGKAAPFNGAGAAQLPGLVGPGESTGDTNSTTGNGGPPNVSHVSFCYDVEQVFEGCTIGYWKNHTESWAPTGYTTGQTLVSVFGANALPGSLLDALSFPGGSGVTGGKQILLRSAVAALLNSAHPGVDYPRTTASVIADVQAALASGNRGTMLALAGELQDDNELGCPLD